MTALRIGTRGSPLALAQAQETAQLLSARLGIAAAEIEIKVISTSGDRIQDRSLADAGGKGLFTKEIEEALIAREIDLAVHSFKDVATVLPPGLGIVAVLEREDPRDAFISKRHMSFDDMPSGAVVGTSSLRRQAQILRARPDLKVVGFRGNVQTRLRKLDEGVAEATFLAVAGLNRLGNQALVTQAIDVDTMIPAVAQGAIGIEVRLDDNRIRPLVAALDHAETRIAIDCERAFLARLDGSCRTPIAGHARLLPSGDVALAGEILIPDGRERHYVYRIGRASDAAAIGDAAAQELLRQAGPDFLGARG